MTKHERLNAEYIIRQMRFNPHYTAGFYNFPYVGKTDEDKRAYALGRKEASGNILSNI
jgi:hypothetical protein